MKFTGNGVLRIGKKEYYAGDSVPDGVIEKNFLEKLKKRGDINGEASEDSLKKAAESKSQERAKKPVDEKKVEDDEIVEEIKDDKKTFMGNGKK